MNHRYRSIWNDVTRTFVAVAEVACGRGKRSKDGNASSAAAATAPAASRLRPLALEPRLMFDAAAVAAVVDTVHAADAAAADTGHAAVLAEAAQRLVQGVPVAVAQEQEKATAATPRHEVVFIDTAINDWQALRDGVRDGVEVVLLDATRDGLAQIAQWAATHSGYDALHVLSHGAEGEVHLGSLSLDTTTAAARADDLRTIGGALTAQGDLLLYGCDVATGRGQVFLSTLAELTGADVAASHNRTGAATLRGDWVLEAHQGSVEADGVVDPRAQQTFTHVLADPTLTTVTTLTGGTEDTAYTLTYADLLAASDAADADTGDTLVFRVEAVSSGTLTKVGVAVTAGVTTLGTGESLVWTPAADANGTLNAFTVKAVDGGGGVSATAAQVSVAVAAVNDAPTLDLNGTTAGTGTTVALSGTTTLAPDAALPSDVDFGAGAWNGATLNVVRWNTTANARDAVNSDVFALAASGVYQVSGTTLQRSNGAGFDNIATISITSSIQLTFTANATAADVQYALQHITYSTARPFGDSTLRFSLSDGTATTTADATVTSSIITVTTTSDDADGYTGGTAGSNGFSLREALARGAAQAGADTIVLDPVLSSGNATFTLNTSAGTLGAGDTIKISSSIANKTATIAASGGGGLALAGNGIIDNSGTGSSAITISTVISGSSGSLTKTGTSSLTLSNSNTFTGGVTLSAGTLSVSGSTRLGSGAVTLDGGDLKMTGVNGTISNAITVNNTGGSITNDVNMTLSGAISGTGTLTKAGTGVLTLSNTANASATGGLTIKGGSVAVASDSRLTGGTVTLNGGGLTVSGATTIDNAITLSQASTLTTSADVTLTGAIAAGTNTLTKAGTGKLTLGTATNSGSAWNLTVSAGSVSVDSASRLGTGTLQLNGNTTLVVTGSTGLANALTLNGNATLQADADALVYLYGTVTGTNRTLSKTGAGTLGLYSFNSGSSFATSVTAGTLTVLNKDQLGTGTVTLDGGTLKLDNLYELDRAIVLGTGGGTLQVTGSGAVVSSVVSGTGNLTKTGDQMLTLSGSNTYSGSTTLTAGTLSVATDANLGSGTIVLNGGTLEVAPAGASTLIDNAVTLAAGGTVRVGSGESATLSGAISGAGGLTKAGAGTLTLSGSNTYAGATSVAGGELVLSGGSAIGDNSAVTVASGATLTTTTSDETIGSLAGDGAVAIGSTTLSLIGATPTTFSGTIAGSGTLALDGSSLTLSGTHSGQGWGMSVLSGGTVSIASGANLGGGTVTLNGGTLSVTGATTVANAISLGVNDGSVTVDTGVAVTLSGALGSSGALTKTGSGTLTLSGSNTYSGTTTVSDGTLAVAADGNLGAGALTLAAGSTLQVTGATTLANAMTLAGAATLLIDAAVTASGTVSGSGSLTKTGSGNLTLSSSTNNYAGGTTLSAGTLTAQLSTGTGSNAIGSGTLTFNGGALTVDSSTSPSFSNAVTLTANGGTVNLSAGTLTTFNGAISGTGHLAVAGVSGGAAETLVLGNTGNSTSWTGNLAASNATVQFAGDNQLAAGSLTLNAGAQLTASAIATVDNAVAIAGAATLYASTGTLTLSGVVSGSGTLTSSGGAGATVLLSGSNTHTGNVNVTSATLGVSGGSAIGDTSAVTLSNGSTLSLQASETIGSLAAGSGNALSLGSNRLTVGGDNTSTTYSGSINGTGGLTKTGSGTWSLGGTNTASGAVLVTAGGLTVSGGSAIGNSSAVTLDAGATLTLSATETIGSLEGAGTVALGSATLSSGSTNASTTFSGSINGTGNLTKTGTGTLTLSGSNGYTGVTTVSGNGGTLSIADASNISSNTLTLGSGSVLEVTGSNVTLSNAFTINTGGGKVRNANALTLSGVVAGVSGAAFNKDGAGVLTMSAANTLPGNTVVSAGTLMLTGSLTATNSVSVLNGATLAGTGTITTANSVVIASGGFLSPGNGGAGTLTLNGDLAMFGTLQADINGTTAGTDYDQVVVNGDVTLDAMGAALSVTHGYTPGLADTYTLIDNDGSDAIADTVAGLAEGGTLTAAGNGTLLTASYLGGDSNDFTLMAPANSAPVVGNLDGDSQAYTAGSTVVLDAGSLATVSDAEDDAGNWNGASLVVQRVTGGVADPSANDVFGFDAGASFTVSGNDLKYAGFTFATFTHTGGVLTINFNGSVIPAGTALVEDVVRYVTYRNDTPYGDATLRFALTDSVGATVNSDVTLTCAAIYVDQANDDADGDAADGFSLREALARGDAQAGADTVHVVLADGSTITLGSNIDTGAGDTLALGDADHLTITGQQLRLGGDFTITNDSGDTATLTTTLNGGSLLTKAGDGTLVLASSDNSHWHSGDTLVTGGTLAVAGDSQLGTGTLTLDGGTLDVTGATTLDNTLALGSHGGTLAGSADWTASGAVSGSGALVKAGSGTLTLSGTSTHAGATTVTEGTLAVAGDAQLGSGAITLNGGTLSITASGTVDNQLVIGADDGTVALASGLTATLSGTVSGSGTLVKAGAGTLALSNTGNSAAAWGTQIDAGRLAITAAGQLGTGTLVLDGGTLQVDTSSTLLLASALQVDAGGGTIDATGSGTGVVLSLSGAMSGSGALGLNAGDSQLHLSQASGLTGELTLSSSGGGMVAALGTSTLGSGQINLADGTTLGVAGSSRTFGNTIVLQGDATLRSGAPANGSDTITFSGTLSESGGARNLTVTGYDITGNSTTVALTGSNTYSGTTTLTAGRLAISGDGNLGAGTVVLNGGTLSVSGAGTIDNGITLGVNDGTVDAAAALTLSGALAGSGTLEVTGSGTLTLSNSGNATTFTGATDVRGGALSVASDAQLGSGTITLNAGTLTLTAATTVDNALALVAGGGTVVVDAAAATLSGNLSGDGGLAKAGSAVLTLSGTGSYTGSTQVGAGTLQVTGALAGTADLTVASGATLAGTGSIGTSASNGAVFVQSGGTLAPGLGAGSTGTLTLHDGLRLDTGAELLAEVRGSTAGSGHDQVVVEGSVDLNGGTLTLDLGRYTATAGEVYALVRNDASDAVSSAFDGLAEGAILTATDGRALRLGYAGGDGNDVVLTALNAAPTVANGLTAQGAAEDSAFSFTVPSTTFADLDVGDTPTYAATQSDGSALPSWLAFDATTRTFSGTPANGDVGSITVRVTATDGGHASVSSDFTLTVSNSNDAPTTTGITAQTATEDSAFNFTVPSGAFADVDAGDTLTYAATLSSGNALPSWLSFDATTRTFSGTPANGDVGAFTVRVTATDAGSASVSSDFTLTVANSNDAPTSTGIAAQTAIEDSAFNFTVSSGAFTDVDVGDTLTYAATLGDGSALPSWLSFDAATRMFSGTPANGDVGSITARVTATDGSHASVSSDFTLTVGNSNDAPTTTGIAAQTATEDSAFNFTVSSGAFTDVDAGDTLTYAATLSSGNALPSWLSFDATTSTFSGTPANGDVGSIMVRVTATDAGSASVSSDFTLTVSNINEAPTTTGIAAQTATEDSAFNFAVPSGAFADVDAGDTLTYAATLSNGSALPGWLSFDSTTRTFSGTPANGDVGSITVRVTATDGSHASASSDFMLTVGNSNDAPTSTGIAARTAIEDSAFNFTVPSGAFTDVDASDTLTYAATLGDGSALPTWLSFDATTRTFSGTPANGDVGAVTVRVTATDAGSASVSSDFALTVSNSDDAPTTTGIAAQTATEDSAFNFAVPSGAFADVDAGDTLTYAATLGNGSALPAWLSFDVTTRTFSGTPANDDVGVITVRVTATDGSHASVSSDFTLTVGNSNDAPTSTGIAAQAATEDSTFNFTVSSGAFTDVDAGDTLIYAATLSNGNALPSWLNFDAATRTFSGTPTNGDVGSITVRVTATDGSSASVSSDFTLTVGNANDAPTSTGIAAQAATEDSAFNFTVPSNTFADVDAGDALIYAATLSSGSALPGWLSFDSTTRTFSGTPANGDVGVVTVRVTATDGSHASVSSDFTLTVGNTNDAPTSTGIAAQTATEDSAFNFTVPSGAFTDVDVGETLSYAATLGDGSALPSWLSFDATTRTFSGTPANGDVGAVTVRVTATDGSHASASSDFTLTVGNTNDAPTSTGIAAQTATEDSAFNFTVPSGAFTDVDASDTLTYAATLGDGNALPSWLSFDATTRTFSGTPANGDVGAISIRVTVTDGSHATVSSDFTLTVVNAGDVPVLAAPETIRLIDTAAGDSFVPVAGQLSAHDDDGGPLRFAVEGGTVGAYTVEGQAYDLQKVGHYGTLWLDSGSGRYVYVADAAAVNQASVAVQEAFVLVASDGATAGQATLVVDVAGVDDPSQGSVLLAGTPQVGQVLTAAVTASDAEGVSEVRIRWQLQDAAGHWSDIAGAQGATLTLDATLAQHAVRAVARITDATGAGVDLVSAASTAVDPLPVPTVAPAGAGVVVTPLPTMTVETSPVVPSGTAFFTGTPSGVVLGGLLLPGSAPDAGARPSLVPASAGRDSSGSPANGASALQVVPQLDAVSTGGGAELSVVLPLSSYLLSVPEGRLAVEARLADGQPLPAWLRFDPATGKLTGRVPASVQGVIEVVLTVRDGHGQAASTRLEIRVDGGGAAPAEPPAPGDEAAPLQQGAAATPQRLAGAAERLAARPGLSAQLRQVGQRSTLADRLATAQRGVRAVTARG